MTDTTYNGLTNYHTWNVALYIQNEENLYLWAQECSDYQEFVDGLFTETTPDGVSWTDLSQLDTSELDEMLEEL